MTWVTSDESPNYTIPSLDLFLLGRGKEFSVVIFQNTETGEVKLFTKRAMENIGINGILENLNSPTPASSQSGE